MSEMNRARAVFYTLFSALFTYGTPKRSYADLIAMLETIRSSDFDSEATKACESLLDLIRSDENALEEEFENIFVLPFGSIVPITASIYFDQREAGEPLVKIKELLLLAKMIKDENNFSENEDHFGVIFGFAAKLLSDETTANNTIFYSLYRDLIAPFAPRFAQAILQNEKAVIYKHIAVLLERFLAFEEGYLSAK